MVEFAITLPLLLLLLLAIGEFGRMLYQYNSLLQASRDSVRFVAGQAWNATTGQIDLNATLLAQAQNVALYGVPANPGGYPAVVTGLTAANVQVSAQGAEHVQVSINYTFCPVIGGGNCTGQLPGFYGGALGLGIPLVASTVMRVL
ncbi:pilus assembly protein [Pseudomonas sp. N040]|nr:TadE/TadG family type IV pilus assembly protein [Pseudomonas sp. N040]MBF7728647.1 pilus assembly protein [Pseudomonas sp. N040]MBW7012287.1 pilus assembly protein [Pseudomonas sp. N040]